MQSKKILVGVSGGVDSAVLLHALSCFSTRESGPTLVAAHVHHGLRGQEADLDQEQARQLAWLHHVPFVARRVGNDCKSDEQSLREARLQALRQIATEMGASMVVLGQHQQDQAETLLLRLFRGSDVPGLAGMQVLRDGFWFRPLLDLGKSAIEQEARHRNLPYRVDQSNFDTSYRRNAIRHNVLPMLQSQFNPNIIAHLAALTTSFAQLDACLDETIAPILPEVSQNSCKLDRKAVQQLHIVLRKRLFQQVFQKLAGPQATLNKASLALVDDVVTGNTDTKSVSLPEEIGVVCKADVIIFGKGS